MSENSQPGAHTRSERELVGEIGRWVLTVLRTDPGWETMVVEFKPQGERTYLRVTENRDGTAIPGATGPVKVDSPVLELLDELQRSCYLPGRGSWLSMTVTIAARNWPQPEHRSAARYNFQEIPARFGDEEHYGAQDVAVQLERFPRTRARTPEWAVAMAEDAGVELSYVAPEQDRSAEADDVNPRLRAAALEHAQQPGDQAVAAALREALSAMLILDISGSDLKAGPDGEPVGPDSHIRVQALAQPDGARSLAVYTAVEYAQLAFARHGGAEGRDEPVLLRQPSAAVLEMVRQDSQYDEIVIDPGAEHALRIGRAQIEWVLGMPHNAAVKNALLDNAMSGVLAGLLNPNGHLLLGTREHEGNALPVMVQPEDPEQAPDTIMVFTSAAEIAALDTTLQVRAAPSREILRFAVDSGAAGVCINALPPVATVPTQQLQELLDLVAQNEPQTP